MSGLFEPFPKMARLTRDCVITEKIDGTNAQVFIVSFPVVGVGDEHRMDTSAAVAHRTLDDGQEQFMFAGSRTRFITPTMDNAGFAAWVAANTTDLWMLGPGRHFGEWWGSKIQRGYGQAPGVRHFSLFNVSRRTPENTPSCCRVVPELYRGVFSESAIEGKLAMLRAQGSVAAPGFMDPEGIVIYHVHAGAMFKKTLQHDEQPKGMVSA